jgi:hypothetical protein
MFVPIARGTIGFAGWYFIGILTLIGWASFRSRKRIATMPTLPSRARHFTNTMIMLSLITLLAVLVARVERMSLFPRTIPTPLQIGAGLAIAGVLAACMRPLWRQSVAQGDRRVYLFTPSNALERGLWIGVSLVAGVGEEITYRGVLYVLFLTLTHTARSRRRYAISAPRSPSKRRWMRRSACSSARSRSRATRPASAARSSSS